MNPGPRLLLLQSDLKPSDSWAVPRVTSKSPQDGGGHVLEDSRTTLQGHITHRRTATWPQHWRKLGLPGGAGNPS